MSTTSLRCVRTLLLCLPLILSGASDVLAEGAARLTLRITDPSGVALPGVSVTARPAGDARVALTDVEGLAQLVLPAEVSVQLSVHLEGFRGVEIRNVVLKANRRYQVGDLRMFVADWEGEDVHEWDAEGWDFASTLGEETEAALDRLEDRLAEALGRDGAERQLRSQRASQLARVPAPYRVEVKQATRRVKAPGSAAAARDLDSERRPRVLMTTSHGTIEIELFRDEAPKTVANFLGLAEGTKEFTDPKTSAKTKRPYYDGLIFHRVIDGFMIQGGCPLGNGTGDPGYRFEDEINATALGLDRIKVLSAEGAPHAWLQVQDQSQFAPKVLAPVVRSLGITNQEDFNSRVEEVTTLLNSLTLRKFREMEGYRHDATLPSSHPPVRGSLVMASAGPDTNGSQFFINLADTPWLTGKNTVFGRVLRGIDVVERIGKVPVGSASQPLEPVVIESIRWW